VSVPASSADLRGLRSTALSTATPTGSFDKSRNRRDDGVFRYHHDAVADEVLSASKFGGLPSGVITTPSAMRAFFVDNGAVDHAVAPIRYAAATNRFGSNSK